MSLFLLLLKLTKHITILGTLNQGCAMSIISDDDFKNLLEKSLKVKTMLQQGATPAAVHNATGVPLPWIYQLESEITDNAQVRSVTKREQHRKIKAKRKSAKQARKQTRSSK